MLLRHIVAFSLLATSTGVLADALDINLNNKTAQFQYSAATSTSTQGKSELHLGLLYNNVNSVFVNGGFMVTGNTGAPGLSIGAGVEAVVATIKELQPTRYNASALALDGLVRFSPPAASQLGFVGEIHYAPNIITYGDADHFRQLGARVEFEFVPQAMLYVGYRQVRFGMKNRPDATLDDRVHVGLKISF